MRSALLVFCALLLFLAGLLLLFAPVSAQEKSGIDMHPFPCGENGGIMGAQILQGKYFAGG